MDLKIEVDAFKTGHIVKEEECVTFRTSVKCKEEFQKWKGLFCQQNSVCYTVYRALSVGQRKLLRQTLICHHGIKRNKGVKKTYTGCKAFLEVSIKKVHSRSSADVREFPCFMKIKGNHNHPLDTVDVLKQLRVSLSTRETFESYFRQGMSPSEAYSYHTLKMDLSSDLYNQANKSVNPSAKSIEYMWRVWRKSENEGLKNPTILDAISRYAKDNPEVILKISQEKDPFSIVLITPFMMRAHRQLKEAGEVVFVNTACCVDQLNTAVTLFVCVGPAGAVPLAIVFTSSQDGATLTKGFGLVKESIGECAFYGKGAPEYFVTDDNDVERKAIELTWPTSQQFLSIFEILQQIWRWLLDSKHGINKDDRQHLMSELKSLVYADSREAFSELLEKIQNNPVAGKYSNFQCYLTTLVQRREEWAVAFRAGTVLTGHHIDNYSEAAICIIRDNLLNRCTAYNTAQLVMFMAEIFDFYMRQCILDVALNRRQVKRVIMDTLPLETVQPLGGGVYQVQSERDPEEMYNVDLNIYMCTCLRGNRGVICKHQLTCANHQMSAVPQMLLLNNCSRHQLAALAFGEEKKNNESEKAAKENSEKEINDNSGDDVIERETEATVIERETEATVIETETEATVIETETEATVIETETEATVMELETEATVMEMEWEKYVIQNSITDEHYQIKDKIAEAQEAAEAFVKMYVKYGNEGTHSNLQKFQRRVMSIKSTNQLIGFLNSRSLVGNLRHRVLCGPRKPAVN